MASTAPSAMAPTAPWPHLPYDHNSPMAPTGMTASTAFVFRTSRVVLPVNILLLRQIISVINSCMYVSVSLDEQSAAAVICRDKRTVNKMSAIDLQDVYAIYIGHYIPRLRMYTCKLWQNNNILWQEIERCYPLKAKVLIMDLMIACSIV